MKHGGGLNMYSFFHCSFPSSLGCLIDLVSARTGEEQQEVKPKCGWAALTYLCIYFWIYSLPPMLAGFPFAGCPSIQL